MSQQPAHNQGETPEPYQEGFQQGQPYYDGQIPQPPAQHPHEPAQHPNQPAMAPNAYVPTAVPQKTMKDVKKKLVTELLWSVGFIVVPLVIYYFSGRLFYVLPIFGVIGLCVALYHYFKGRAEVGRQSGSSQP